MSLGSTFPPSREQDLLAESLNFKTRITATPTVFSLTAAQASSYGALHDLFASALALANADATRSPMNIELKNVAKFNLVKNLRLLAGIVQNAPTTTNAMRLDLGIPERDPEPTPVPPPAFSPTVVVTSVDGRVVRTKLIDLENPTRRSRPGGVDGISLFQFVGANPPEKLTDWVFAGNSGRMVNDITFGTDVPAGSKVWITAFYFNQRKESGPIADPVSTTVYSGMSMAA